MKKKLLSIVLVLCMVLPLLPSPANALNRSIVYPRTKLKDVYVNGFPYQYSSVSNWITNKNNVMFTDKNGNVGLFSYKDGNKPRAYIFDKDYKVLSDTVINLPSHDYFGTFAVAADGDYYVVVGHKNTEENTGKTVVNLLKVSSKTGDVIKKGDLKAKQFGSDFSSITVPFEAGTAELVENGGKIYIHMAYKMFRAKDGKNHQAANLFVFDSGSLKPTYVKSDFYVSHSFNQLIKLDGGTIVTLSHGDAYPRAIRLATMDSKGNFNKSDIFSFKGASGKNETGSTVTGLEIGKSNYLVTGTSVTHNQPVNGKYSPSNEWYKGRNVYLSVVNKKNLSPKHIWLTTFDPNNKDTTITDPRIFKSGNSFVVVYSVSKGDTTYTEFVTVDENGKILARNKKDKTAFYSNSYPLLVNNKIIWIAPWAAGTDYYYVGNTKIYKYKFDDTGRVYLFEVDISSPSSPKWIEGIRPQSVVIEQKNVFLDRGNATKLTAKVVPSTSPFDDILWLSGNTGKYSITKDGYVTALSGGATDKVFAQSEIDQSIYATVPITTNASPKSPTSQERKSAIATAKDKHVGLYSTKVYYPLEKGKQTSNIQLKSASGNVPKYYLTSSDESIVKIKDSTIAVGVEYGTATVYFHTADKQNVASCVVEVVPPKADGTYIIKMPKTDYKLGDPFETEGFVAAQCSDNGKKIKYYTDKQVYFIISKRTTTEITEAWGRGKPLTDSGTTEVRVLVGGTVLRYNINVGKNSSNGADNSSYTKGLQDGHYNLRCMNNYMNIAANGGAELRNVTPNPVYDIKRQTDGNYTIKTSSGKYLGIADTIKDGIQLKEVSTPYLWKLYSENNNDIFSLRPATNLKMVVNAAGEKNIDGTWIILWTYENTNSPNHAEFRFIQAQ